MTTKTDEPLETAAALDGDTTPQAKPVLMIVLFSGLVSVMLFFLPYVLGQKEPAIVDGVEQNMAFLDEMVNKYIEKYKAPPTDLNTLVKDAKDNRYNKTFFNPIRLHGGNIDSERLSLTYSKEQVMRLGPGYTSELDAGKTGYYYEGLKYAIYGHGRQGVPIQKNGQILVFSNY